MHYVLFTFRKEISNQWSLMQVTKKIPRKPIRYSKQRTYINRLNTIPESKYEASEG